MAIMDLQMLPQGVLSLPTDFDLYIQIFLAVVLAVYSIYAFIVMKQVHILNKSIRTSSSILLNILAQVHFTTSLGLLVIAILLALF